MSPDPLFTDRRKLNGRHLQFIAIGGAIGAGLFVGSSEAISQAGPAVILAYAACGFVIFLIARALGELVIKHPDAGGFSAYAGTYIGGWAGFITGWSYWLNWVLVVIAEMTAIGLMIRYWLPEVPQWLPGLIALSCVWLINLTAARVFAETEFAITLIKVLTIVLLIVVGGAEILLHHSSSYGPAAPSNLWTGGGFLPFGWRGFLGVLPLILFAFGGVEVIGVAAAEIDNPVKTVPRAINSTVIRILLFYVGSLIVVMSLVPWSFIHTGSSPFVLAFGAIGVLGAAGLVNFVVVTAIISACNTGVFATSRVLRGLALAGQAPATIAKLNGRGVPVNALTVSVLSMLIGVGLNYIAPKQVFSIIMRADAALMLWIWLTIVWSHMNYRRRENIDSREVAFGLPGAPYSNLFVMAFIAFICAFNFLDRTSAAIFALSLTWFGALGLLYVWIKRRRPASS
jgi:AAT family amino acid transporter/D-serine/D-alanine/glycine transporter